jgi:hypothetical protein
MNHLAITVLSAFLLLSVFWVDLNESKPLNSDETWLDSMDAWIGFQERAISRRVRVIDALVNTRTSPSCFVG